MTLTKHRGSWSHVDPGESPALLVAHGPGQRAVWPRVAAFEYARHQLLRLNRELLPHADLPTPSLIAQQRMMAVLRSVLASDSIYPTITFDDEEDLLVAEWRAGAKSIDIEISANGSAHFTVRSQRGAVLYEGSSETALRRHLRDLTSWVTRSNPRWRSMFSSLR